ncbi:hypothetical protein ACFQI7_16925 [Paenibacillus allorhizosphaerae]|uniref:hypothetical protein n=1 Tax=Paenibacillus allorhizosphaerae TaxID=2849866 RepID=UPI001C403834|nr:hypothetical protein [Paenibacillus allorhizosphaerae]
MRAKFIYVIGVMFIIASGVVYTIERAAASIAGQIKLAGFYAGHLSGEVPSPQMPRFSRKHICPRISSSWNRNNCLCIV